jgi:hypothetical protein
MTKTVAIDKCGTVDRGMERMQNSWLLKNNLFR